jgi:ribonuclease HI
MPVRIEGWFDGCTEPINPGGHASWGALIKIDGETVWQASAYVGHGPTMSNNVAEYSGAIACMRQILGLDPYGKLKSSNLVITLRGDSMLVIKQLSGEWRVKRGLYVPYYQQAVRLRAQLPQMRLEWIPRNLNAEADLLSKRELSDRRIEFRLQKERN